MYQALYRKWRPLTFDDVVGQSHITDTLKRQVDTSRLSHAYLFTGTRGTGKTSCAKILARAVNCEHPVEGNPCNKCPACIGIQNGSILDVLELDAASNNGVDQVRALRDEAVYTPASVRKRVYIVDEVHMLSTPAFNALLKILEEPPEHLMFILATTELHKVPATIKSRCQQFSFKRILPGDISQRLSYVAQQEKIELTSEGAGLLARLADGGLRDALSLLDQCVAPNQTVDEPAILEALGLAGNLKTAALMEQIGSGDTAGALDTFSSLYGAGKDVSALLGELSALTRDLLVRKTAPQGGVGLLTGGFDENSLRRLESLFSKERLVQMLGLLQSSLAELSRSGSRRTDGELCLIRLCDVTLSDNVTALAARIARLEGFLTGNTSAVPPAGNPVLSCTTSHQTPVEQEPAPGKARETQPVNTLTDPVTDVPPWEAGETGKDPKMGQKNLAKTDQNGAKSERNGQKPEQTGNRPLAETPPNSTAISKPKTGKADTGDFWPGFSAALNGVVKPQVYPFFKTGDVTGTYTRGVLTLWVADQFYKEMIGTADTLQAVTQLAQQRFGCPVRVSVSVGTAPQHVEADGFPPVATAAAEGTACAPPDTAVESAHDGLDDLLAFGEQFDNIIIS